MSIDTLTIKAIAERELGEKIETVKVLQTGWAGEVFSCTLKNGKRYILKTYASDTDGAKSIKTEWNGLNFLHNANHPVPKPFHMSLGRPIPHIVMEEIKGVNFWIAYKSATGNQQEKLLSAFVKLLYDLHHLDTQIASASNLKDSTSDFLQREIGAIIGLLTENSLIQFSSVIEWLDRGRADITTYPLSILHRDYHPWNVVVGEDGRLYMIDIVWGIGDFRFDLAWTTTLLARSGFTDMSTLIKHEYAKIKQVQNENSRYFDVLATQRWLTNVLIGLKTGRNLNETRKEEFEAFVLPLITNGLRLIEEHTGIRIDKEALGINLPFVRG